MLLEQHRGARPQPPAAGCSSSSSVKRSGAAAASSSSHADRTAATAAITATSTAPSSTTSVVPPPPAVAADAEDETSYYYGIESHAGPAAGRREQRANDDDDDVAPCPPPPTAVVTIPSPVFSRHSRGPPPPPPASDGGDRAVHAVRLGALERNFRCVEGAAHRQRCSVIAVVKADGYGHGAIATALHLADCCGADAFAVATLEEGIALRKAFQENPPGRWKTSTSSSRVVMATTTTTSRARVGQQQQQQMAIGGSHTSSTSASGSSLSSPTISTASQNSAALHQRSSKNNNNNNNVVMTTQQHVAAARCCRPTQIRILVLGPPVGYPKCFNDYHFYGIEAMISGPEVATALAAWVANDTERRRTAVERAAMETKEQALLTHHHLQSTVVQPPSQLNNNAMTTAAAAEEKKEEAFSSPPSKNSSAGSNESSPTTMEGRKKSLPHPASTLGNVQGRDLAKEVRLMLLNQKAATEKAAAEAANAIASQRSSPAPSDDGAKEFVTAAAATTISTTTVSTAVSHAPAAAAPAAPAAPTQVFEGIEAVAKNSRARAMVNNNCSNNSTTAATATTTAQPPVNRKRLRWHALVDSGMGRLGFKTDPVVDPATEGRRDTVEILQELVHAEIYNNAPIEFFGMCTHMADANATSTYTHSQMDKFGALLERVRDAGISVPTVSTDNSAALLTASLTHFDPDALLAQPNTNTRGYVRCGGAVFGQRPSFRELQPLSTLTASVRHVAELRQGESVGYDRAYVAAFDVRIATLTIGFADGYPRELGNGVGKVSIRGSLFPVAGNVCMDMLMVELGPADEWDGVGATVVVGDTAVLWGNEDLRLQDVAATLKTTQSALTCGLNTTRVARLYV